MGFVGDVPEEEVNRILGQYFLLKSTERIKEIEDALEGKSVPIKEKKEILREHTKKIMEELENVINLSSSSRQTEINEQLKALYNKIKDLKLRIEIADDKLYIEVERVKTLLEQVEDPAQRLTILEHKDPITYMSEKISYPLWLVKKEVDEIQDNKEKRKVLENEIKDLENRISNLEKEIKVTPEQKIDAILDLMENLTITNDVPYENASSLYKDCVEKMEFYTQEIMENIEKVSEETRKNVIKILKSVYESLRDHVERVMDDLSTGKNQQYMELYFELLRSGIYCAKDLKKKVEEEYNRVYHNGIKQVCESLSKIRNMLPEELDDIKRSYKDLIPNIKEVEKSVSDSKKAKREMERCMYEYIMSRITSMVVDTSLKIENGEKPPIDLPSLRETISSYLEKLEKGGPLYLDEEEFSKYLERGRKTLERIRALESSLKETYATQT